MMEKDVDVLQQYRNISNKLKKRFLKKPNISEGSEQFAGLAKQLKSQECPQYAGFCNLAQARCEHTLGNWCAEAQALSEAARNFLQAEQDVQDLNCPSFQEHLHASINCYSHAIRVYLENKQSSLAAGLCMELGNTLKSLGRPGEAIQHYQRAAELHFQSPLLCLQSLGYIASAKIATKDYEGALSIFTEMFYMAQSHGASDGTSVIGAYRDILVRCEVSRVLLLMLLQPTAQKIRPEHAQTLEKYSWQCKEEDIAASHFTEDLFLLLQSVVMACQSRDAEVLKSLQSGLWTHFTAEQNHLMHVIIEQLIQPYPNTISPSLNVL
jgi:tetratricopeptide (TPR) repeat protein